VHTIPFTPVNTLRRFRLVAWLCLALLLLTGSAPSQGFVVCIEADGCVSIEVKAANLTCRSCEGHESDELASETASDPSTNPECPCTDYVVPAFPDEQVFTNRSSDLQVGPWITPAAELHVVQPPHAPTSERGPPPRTLRVAQSLAHIRTVILLI